MTQKSLTLDDLTAGLLVLECSYQNNHKI